MDKKCKERTLKYYSKWLGAEAVFEENRGKIVPVYSEERNRIQPGYGQPFSLYVFCGENKIIISYGDVYKKEIPHLVEKISAEMPVEQIKAVMEESFGKQVNQNIKYVFGKMSDFGNGTRPLVDSDYDKYENFFKSNNSNCSNIDWLPEYFQEMVQEKTCIGIFEQEELACCTDAPTMPFMKEFVQEIGITTLEKYRKRGYASEACSRCVQEILNQGKIPLWSTGVQNTASQKLAEKVGFIKLADVLTLSL